MYVTGPVWVGILFVMVLVSMAWGGSLLQPGSTGDPSNTPEAVRAIVERGILGLLQGEIEETEADQAFIQLAEQIIPQVSRDTREIFARTAQDASAATSPDIQKSAADELELFVEQMGVPETAAVAEAVISGTLGRLELTPIDLTDAAQLEFKIGSAASIALQCNRNIVSLEPVRLLLFEAGLLPEPPCPDVADVNQNAEIDSVDAFLMNFRDAVAPGAPGLQQLADATVGTLSVAILTGISSAEEAMVEALEARENVIASINREETGRLTGKQLGIVQESALASILAVLGGLALAELIRLGSKRFTGL